MKIEKTNVADQLTLIGPGLSLRLVATVGTGRRREGFVTRRAFTLRVRSS
jgi:hypothetical protein